MTPLDVDNIDTGDTAAANVLVDDCAQDHFIDKEFAHLLRLEGPAFTYRLCGADGIPVDIPSRKLKVRLRPKTSDKTYEIEVFELPGLSNQYDPPDWCQYQHHWPHLKEIPFSPLASGRVKLLIGSKNSTLSTSIKDVVGGEDQPVARLTPLGWSCSGPT